MNPPGNMERLLFGLDSAGWWANVHAIGDEAIDTLLTVMEKVMTTNAPPPKERRWRIIHSQVIRNAAVAQRYKRLGIIAEVQPYHAIDDMRWMEERIGFERTKGAYAFKSIQASGAVLSFGTDWPGTSASEYPINPMLGLYAAVTRQTVTGQPAAGWFPNERISIEDAIRAYTLNTAYANFEEKIKGSIEVGKLADLTVLSKNLLKVAPKEYLTTEVLYTIVGGKIVYSRSV
jgi:predicted amidohydrolase YtcJ